MKLAASLYIIGNRFDLHHGLPTSYWDYREFLEARNSTDLSTFESGLFLEYSSISTLEKDALWGELEESLAIDWCDFVEYELEHNYPSMADTHPGWDDAAVAIDCDAGFLERLTDDCLRRWIASVDFSHCQSIMDFESDALFVTFNYTDVLEDVYGIEPARVFHVHGRASDRSDCLQFGTPKMTRKKSKCFLSRNSLVMNTTALS